jgi:hypothetical protein
MNIKNTLNYLFNWKKNPASVFVLAVPLVIIGFGLMFIMAILQMKLHSDPWYLVIFACGIGLLMLGLWPIRKPLMAAFNNKN